MSRSQYKKRYSAESEDYSEASYKHDGCGRDDCNNRCQACIVCPPCDYREKYESESSERSCPDFAELCEDKPKICCEKKELCKKKYCKDDHEKKEYNQSYGDYDKKWKNAYVDKNHDYSYGDYDSKKKSKGCKGCDRQCHSCNACQLCGCRECSDYSASAVVRAIGTESESCPNFEGLACDQKKQCCELVSLCKKDCEKKDCEKKDCEKKQWKDDKKEWKEECVPCKRDWKDDTRDWKDESREWKDEKIYQSDKSVKHVEKKDYGASSAASGKGKKFVVSFGAKTGHPWAEYNDDPESIWINGKNGPVLHLYRGCTYFFCVEQKIVDGKDPSHAFVLTNSPAGGSNSIIIPGGFAPVSKGCVCFKVDKCTPRYFFYQDAKHDFEGGLVIVHDSQ